MFIPFTQWYWVPLQAPPEESAPLFLQYAALEEEHGLARSAMEVYDRAVRTVPETERLPIYDQYIKKASNFFGIAKVQQPPGPLASVPDSAISIF